MPELIRFMVKNFAIGAVIGWSFGATLMLAAPRGLGVTILSADALFLPVALMLFSLGTTFGMGYLSTALAMLPRE